MKEQKDPYLRLASEIVCPLGMTPLDAASIQPARTPSLVRTYENINDREEKDFPRSGDEIMAKGAAVGLDKAGYCRHFWPDKDLNFIGFLEGQTGNRAIVKTRGSVVLKIEDATDKDCGRPVYCLGPNSFILSNLPGTALIGAIRFVQVEGRAHVAFRRYNDTRPLILDILR